MASRVLLISGWMVAERMGLHSYLEVKKQANLIDKESKK